MDKHHWQTVGRATFIDIKYMRPINSEIVPGVGFDLREQGLHYTLRGRVEVIPDEDFKNGADWHHKPDSRNEHGVKADGVLDRMRSLDPHPNPLPEGEGADRVVFENTATCKPHRLWIQSSAFSALLLSSIPQSVP